MRLDAASRLHLRLLSMHLVIILAFALPSLLLGASWHGLLARLALTLRAAAAGLGVMALLVGHRWPRRSLCLWDEVAALLGLALLCSLLAPTMRVAAAPVPSHVSAPG